MLSPCFCPWRCPQGWYPKPHPTRPFRAKLNPKRWTLIRNPTLPKPSTSAFWSTILEYFFLVRVPLRNHYEIKVYTFFPWLLQSPDLCIACTVVARAV